MIVAADAARRELFRLAVKIPALRSVTMSRTRRVTAVSTVLAVASAAFATRAPLLSLWAGAAVLGVPHLVSEVRQTVLTRRVSAATLLLCAGVLVINVAGMCGARVPFSWALQSAAIFSCVFVELYAARRTLFAALALAPLSGVAYLCASHPGEAIVVVTHVHAIGSIAFFAIVALRARSSPVPLLVISITFAAAVLSGAFDAWLPEAPFVPEGARGSLFNEIQGTAFVWADAAWLRRLVTVYAFGQAIHYGIWIHLLPDLDRRTPVPKPLARKIADARGAFGAFFIPVATVTALSIPLLLLGGSGARQVYFGAAFFHFALEIGSLTRLLARHGVAKEPIRVVTAAPVHANQTPVF